MKKVFVPTGPREFYQIFKNLIGLIHIILQDRSDIAVCEQVVSCVMRIHRCHVMHCVNNNNKLTLAVPFLTISKRL